tara:strand:+ start:141 stop:464 length:324 start_codon:yes stop_codon:yes gene_type:complete
MTEYLTNLMLLLIINIFTGDVDVDCPEAPPRRGRFPWPRHHRRAARRQVARHPQAARDHWYEGTGPGRDGDLERRRIDADRCVRNHYFFPFYHMTEYSIIFMTFNYD